jgi:hypothetical protein
MLQLPARAAGCALAAVLFAAPYQAALAEGALATGLYSTSASVSLDEAPSLREPQRSSPVHLRLSERWIAALFIHFSWMVCKIALFNVVAIGGIYLVLRRRALRRPSPLSEGTAPGALEAAAKD